MPAHPARPALGGAVRLACALAIAAVATTARAHPPEIDGEWSPLETWPTAPTHAHLLPNGKVLFWSEYMDGDKIFTWDPATHALHQLTSPGYNPFCAGHAFLGDGRLLVAGGHADQPFPNTGLPYASLFDPATESWSRFADMNEGRWYPTATTLADGGALVTGGWVHEGDIDDLPQVWDAGATKWRDLTTARRVQDLYPRMILGPDGHLVEAGPDSLSRLLDTSGTGEWIPLARTHAAVTRTYGSAVMYRPGQVLVIGGGDPPLDSVERIDLTAESPSYVPVASMAGPRRQLDATLLPDGRVLVTGGSRAPGFDNGTLPALTAESWDPDTGAWTTLAAQAQYRGYHSIALLLPDGRVLSGGGRVPGLTTVVTQPTIEIYSPPYLFHGPRPAISSAPARIDPGATFRVETPDAARIASVALLRNGSVTHAFDMNQRYVPLSFRVVDGALEVTAPPDSLAAPPGHYMLFLLDGAGVPSVAKIVQVSVRAPAASRLVGLSDTWTFDDSGIDHGDAWRLPGYRAAGWMTGGGRFGFGVDGVATPLMSSTPLPPTYYFRRTITLDRAVSAATLGVVHTDGAAVWVNGVKVYARDVADDLSFGTPATADRPERLHATPVPMSPNPFRLGENVIAAVLKPRGPLSTGEAFSLELRAEFAPPPAEPSTSGPRAPPRGGCGGGAAGDVAGLGMVASLAAGWALRRRRGGAKA